MEQLVRLLITVKNNRIIIKLCRTAPCVLLPTESIITQKYYVWFVNIYFSLDCFYIQAVICAHKHIHV